MANRALVAAPADVVSAWPARSLGREFGVLYHSKHPLVYVTIPRATLVRMRIGIVVALLWVEKLGGHGPPVSAAYVNSDKFFLRFNFRILSVDASCTVYT